ncbi:hypothetical protein [Mycolicibacterium anyangense]|uniref:hypothetical protein n=1 Tax=Mycolicibacterium anyangense TaxID=1431246 RepID=UPI00389967BE
MTARLWPGARSGDVVRALAVLLSTAFVAGLLSPYGRATDDVVTYEVVSDSVGIAGIEYMDAQRRMLIRDVPLPWRLDTTVAGGVARSELRADWRPRAQVRNWVSVRIWYQGKLLCQSTLDIGNATCYGDTPHMA